MGGNPLGGAMFNYFSDIFGIITKLDPTTENGGLFFAHYITLKLILGQPLTQFDYDIFDKKMSQAQVAEGLYLRSKHHTVRTVSHDEITGMIVTSYVMKTNHGNSIMKYLETHFGNYPATGENYWHQPSNYYMWGLLCNRKWTTIFAPLYMISFYIALSKDKQHTSSRLIYFIELYQAKNISPIANQLWKVFVQHCRDLYGEFWVHELFKIYFYHESPDFPLLELSKDIKL